MADPTTTVVCVTRRPEFWGWLRWNLEKQTTPPYEVLLVVPTVLSDLAGELINSHWSFPGVRGVVTVSPHATLGTMRQEGVDAATGDLVVHFDDDDWQHPMRLEHTTRVFSAAADEVYAAGGCAAWFVHLATGKAYRYQHVTPVHSLCGFRRVAYRYFRYDSLKKPVGEDTRFMVSLERRHPAAKIVQPDLSFWLVHGENTSYRPTGAQFQTMRHDLDDVRATIGEEFWGETDVALGDLRKVVKL